MVERKIKDSCCNHRFPDKIRVMDYRHDGEGYRLYDCSECLNEEGKKGARYWVKIPLNSVSETNIPVGLIEQIRARERGRLSGRRVSFIWVD